MSPKGVLPEKTGAWLLNHRRDAVDLLALGVSLLLVRLFIVAIPGYVLIGAFVAAALVPLRSYSGRFSLLKEAASSVPRQVVSVMVAGGMLRYLLSQPLTALWFGVLWPITGVCLRLNYRALWARIPGKKWVHKLSWTPLPVTEEVLRCILLFAAALWLLRGFERTTLHGSAEALWYAMNLADSVTQARAGVFPLFVGQSVFQFNGALCPIRVAPAFNNLGALLDLLTLHRLGVFALQNLLITLLGITAIFSTYLGLRSLLPLRQWFAAGLAALFLACPGVLGIAYNTDLYMTWTTLPLVPLVWYATVLSFRDRGTVRSLALLGATLGLCWWGHSPIALWSTFFAAAAQIVRLALGWRSGFGIKALAVGAAAFVAVAAYPVGSVLFFPPEPVVHTNLYQHATPWNIVYFLDQVSPDIFLPMDSVGRVLSDFQFGYALWAVLLFLLWAQRRKSTPAAAVTAATAVALALLLIPIPRFSLILWNFVPAFVRDVTGNWVMGRLYLPMAAATVFGAAACVMAGLMETTFRRVTLSLIVAGGCAWSFSEASKFAVGSKVFTQTPDSAVDLLRPENIQLTRYSYSLVPDFPAHPATFTHGVTDPLMENRLLAADTQAEVTTNMRAALAASTQVGGGSLNWPKDSPCAVLDSPLSIKAGDLYLLDFTFRDPTTIRGVLQIKGKHFFREYSLPDYGGSRSFGAGGVHAHAFPLSSTAGDEELSVRFYPAGQPTGLLRRTVAETRLLRFEKTSLPVRVSSWIPYKAAVQTPIPAWLETPRVYQTAYKAWVDGKPAIVRKSPESLLAVAVPAGSSTVEVNFIAPPGLKLLFWLSSVSILVAVGYGALRILHLLRDPAPAKASGAASSAQA